MITEEIKSGLIAFFIGLVLGAVPTAYFVHSYVTAQDKIAIDKQKLEASQILSASKDKVIAAERSFNELKNQVEIQDAKTKKTSEEQFAENQRLSNLNGGLRDPGRRQSCSGGVPKASTGASVNTRTSSEGQLSGEATEFLLKFAKDADDVAGYANTCYHWKQVIYGRLKLSTELTTSP